MAAGLEVVYLDEFYSVCRFAAKRSGGFGTLNCQNTQCLLNARPFIFAVPSPFFLGAVTGSLFFFGCPLSVH